MVKDTLKDEILQKASDKAIFSHYLPDWKGNSKTIKSPLTNDTNPSFSMHQHSQSKGWRFNCKSSGKKGDCFQFVADLNNLNCKVNGDFIKICNIIISDLALNIDTNITFPEGSVIPEFTAVFSEAFTKYWEGWGVDKATLEKYNVKQVKTVQFTNGSPKDYSQGVVSCFTVNGRHKVYIPIAPENEPFTLDVQTGKHRKRNYSKLTTNDCFGLEQLKENEDAILCEGEKDVLVLAAKGYSPATFGGANSRAENSVYEIIKAKAKAVFACGDNDEPGQDLANWLKKEFGFISIQLPIEIKDVSDYFKVANKEGFEQLKTLAIEGRGLIIPASRELKVQKIDNHDAEKGKSGLRDTELLSQVKKLYEKKYEKSTGKCIGIKIKQVPLYTFISSLGFYHLLNDQYDLFVKIDKNIVEHVTEVHIQNVFFKAMKRLPEMLDHDISLEVFTEAFYLQNQQLFGAKKLVLIDKVEKEFCIDNRKYAYIFYQNGFTRVSKDGVEFLDYSKLDGLIWKGQVLERDFHKQVFTEIELKALGVFSKFLFNICGKNESRLNELCSIIGYNLHHCFDRIRRATLLTDSKIEGENNGRTGKSILVNAISHIKPTLIFDGKLFDPADRFAYQSLTVQTQIAVLDDVKKDFKIEALFHAITEKITVQPKNQAPFSVMANFIITSNRPIRIEGGSAKGRVVEFEFAEYYNNDFSPYDEYKKMFFTKDFTKEDWLAFDNLMCFCLQTYFQNGLKIPKNNNLAYRKLLAETNEDVVEFINECLSDGTIVTDVWLDKKHLHDLFKERYPDYKNDRWLEKQKTFTMCLIKYINYSDAFKTYDSENDKRHSGTEHFIMLRNKVQE